METPSFISPEIFTWVVMPLLIILARICDVSLGTIRIISIGRGYKSMAPVFGFFQILIWLLAIRQIMQNLNNPLYYIAYAGGFAAGTFVGMYLEERLALGIFLIRVITAMDASELIERIRAGGYGVTSVEAHGTTGKVHIIYTIIKRSDIKEVTKIINEFNPKSFYSIEDVRFAKEGVFPLRKSLEKKQPGFPGNG